MAGETDDIDRQLQAISEAPDFDGLLLRRKRIGPGNTPDDFAITLFGPSGIGMNGLRKMLEVVLERVSDTKRTAYEGRRQRARYTPWLQRGRCSSAAHGSGANSQRRLSHYKL